MKYIWTVIWTVVTTLFSLSILDGFYSQFEIVVVGILLAIYNTVCLTYVFLNQSQIKQTLFIQERFLNLRNDLDPSLDKRDQQEARDELKEAAEALRIAEIKTLISAIGAFVVLVAVVLAILNSM